LHVYVPLKNKYDYVTVKDFAHIIASLVQEQLPEITTLERSLSKRGPKIYIDYLQNSAGKHLHLFIVYDRYRSFSISTIGMERSKSPVKSQTIYYAKYFSTIKKERRSFSAGLK
jgi:DNA primase